MSAIVVSVEYQVGGVPDAGLRRFSAAVERAGAELANVGKHVLPKLIPLMESSVAKQFDARGRGNSGSWAPLSVAYAKWKQANYPGKPLLERSGALRAGLTQSGPNARRDVTGNELTFGTVGVPWASYHQTGTAKMPARAVFDFADDFERGLQSAIAAGVREAVREGSNGVLEVKGNDDDAPTLTGRGRR